jgi:hypothetical protein
MLSWWRERRRERILESPFPEEFRSVLAENVGYVRFLDQETREYLEELMQVFLAEKTFVGCGGLELTDEIRVTIAANACVLLLGLEHDLYRGVESILVYPSTISVPDREQSHQIIHVEGKTKAVLGVAHLNGPVILVWDAVLHGSRDASNGHNVVFHEFAHKLDMLDREADGTPPLTSDGQLARWQKACGEVYNALRERIAQGKKTFLDPYAGHSEAEFFAVATEFFFEKPTQLSTQHPSLYAVLKAFYNQDPKADRTRARLERRAR